MATGLEIALLVTGRTNVIDVVTEVTSRETVRTVLRSSESEDCKVKIKAFKEFKKLFDKEKFSTKQLIDSGAVSLLVKLLEERKLQIETISILKKLLPKISFNVFRDENVVEKLIQLIDSEDIKVSAEAAEALATIVHKSEETRNLALRCGAMKVLVDQLRVPPRGALLEILTRGLRNLYSFMPFPNLDEVKSALPVLRELINEDDKTVLAHVCWTISDICYDDMVKISFIINLDFVPRLANLLIHKFPPVLTAALRAIGMIVHREPGQIQCVIDSGALPRLVNLLTNNHTVFAREQACWMISNITAAQKVVDENLIPNLVDLLRNAEFRIKKHAANAMSNIVSHTLPDRINKLVNKGCVIALCNGDNLCLDLKTEKLTLSCLQALENFLKKEESLAQKIDEAGGLSMIKELRRHENTVIQRKAVTMLGRYWREDRPIWDVLLKWSLSHADGTRPTRPTRQLSEQDRKWFMDAMHSQNVDGVKRMNEITLVMQTPEQVLVEQGVTIEDIADLLDELQEHVESIDKANDLNSVGGLVPLLGFLKSSHANIRAKAADVVSTIVQNNPRSQELVMEAKGLESLLSNFTSDTDVHARTQALGAISSLIRHNKPGVTAFKLANGYAGLREALASDSVRFQRKALNLLQYLLQEDDSDRSIATGLGFPRVMMHLASSEDTETREAALRGLVELAGNSIEKDDEKLRQVLEERIKGISMMSQEDLGTVKEERQLVDLLWNICYNEPSSLREKGLLVLPGEDALPPDVASTMFEPPLRASAANRNATEKKDEPLKLLLPAP